MDKYILIVIFILLTLLGIKIINKNNFYKNIKVINNPNDTLVLVNKNNILPEDYIPNNLVLLSTSYSYENKYLVEEAKINFENLSRDAFTLGYKIIAVSTYRSFAYQKKLYEDYIKEYDFEYAELASARPGHSEHQTGLAVDVMGSNNDYNLFEEAIEFEWMKSNAHKYGFILRYPKNKTNITGFKYEPWHYRYVGENVSKHIFDNNLTLEEYLKK